MHVLYLMRLIFYYMSLGANVNRVRKLSTSTNAIIMASSRRIKEDEVININVGGKKYTARRSDLTVDPNSKLYEWFRTNNNRGPPQDKAGNIYIDRDGKTFRFILDYLRMKKEKLPFHLALPCKPDDITRLVGESDALNLLELKELCVDLLLRYQREEQNCLAAFVNNTLHEFDNWQFEKKAPGSAKKGDPYGDW